MTSAQVSDGIVDVRRMPLIRQRANRRLVFSTFFACPANFNIIETVDRIKALLAGTAVPRIPPFHRAENHLR